MMENEQEKNEEYTSKLVFTSRPLHFFTISKGEKTFFVKTVPHSFFSIHSCLNLHSKSLHWILLPGNLFLTNFFSAPFLYENLNLL